VPEIGATLREARMRAHIDVSEIEAKTKIRAKYLRALENEEWGLLPGPTFVKSFLRTYAQALGLDAKSLVEEYRLHHEGPGESALEPIVSAPHRSGRVRSAGPSRPARANRSAGGAGRPGEGSSRGYAIAVGVIGAAIVLLVVLLIAGSGGSSPSTTSTGASAAHASHAGSAHGARGHGGQTAGGPAATDVVALSLKASALVYVCLIGDGGRKLIPGTELQAGESTPTYHARRFEITLGNSSVTMLIDGRPRDVPPSSQAIGYSLTKARGRHSLAPGELPTCQ
jgi:cytoskeleton protein RodZ